MTDRPLRAIERTRFATGRAHWRSRVAGICLGLAAAAGIASPSQAGQATAAALDARALDGPPPPAPPAIIARDAAGRATLRAVRLDEPLGIDGALDERLYRDVPAASDFIQVLPDEGEPATEQTEIWVAFDDENLYVSGRCHNAAPESEWVASEMRRDGTGLGQYVGILLDTFHDRRNGVELVINPLGGRMDGQITDERAWNGDWNPVWSVRVGRFDGGWTFEAAIPFKSLRYRPGREQTWGFNVERRVVWNNEYSALVPLPASWGYGAVMQVSQAATLVGLEAPDAGIDLELKPYAIGEANGVRAAGPQLSNVLTGDMGLDVKYGVTENLVADLTLNTDFAQVEADEQQVNLTRFSLFFPEKREFFLENQGMFAFGGEAGAGQFAGISNTPILFYSRRIGLHQGREVPIDAGGRLTGRIGRYSLGMLNIQTADAPAARARATNFSVLRVRRDILRRSNIGALFTGRSASQVGPGSNAVYGVDGLFSFYQNLNISTYWAATRTPGANIGDDETSHRAQLDYTGDRYGLLLERLAVGEDFNPEIGFLRRRDFEQSPRPVPVQSAPPIDRVDPPVLLGRSARLRHGPKRRAGNAAGAWPLRDGAGERRPVRRHLQPQLRVPRSPVRDCPGRHHPRGRLPLRRRRGGLPVGTAAPDLRPRLRPARRLLRRHEDQPELRAGQRLLRHPRRDIAAALDRADPLAQPDRTARRPLSTRRW